MTNDGSIPTYTIIHADGLYEDDAFEQKFFASQNPQAYQVKYIQSSLWPSGQTEPKAWSSLPETLRHQVNGIMLLKLSFTADDISLFPALKLIVRMGVGYERLDRIALAQHNITVCNVPDYGTSEVADHALALALTLRRGILLHHDRQRLSPPVTWGHHPSPLIARLQDSMFGVLGLGRIGTAVALRAKAFGFRVLFYDPYVANGVEKSLQIERTRDLRELFRRAEVLSLHCPCTKETRGMVDEGLLGLMRFGAVLVNTGRGEVVNLDAVEGALRSGRLAGAGLDVLPVEPILEDEVHGLIRAYRDREEWLEGRLVVTGHSAFYSPESFEDIRVKSAQTMRDVLIDGLASNVITPEMD